MASLSGQITAKTTYEYNDPAAFFLSGLLAIILLGCIPLLKKDTVRHAAAIISIVVVIAWCALALLFETADVLASDGSKTLLVIYGFAGRFSSILLGIQWNLHFALNRVSSITHTVAATMLLGMALFLAFSILDQFAAILWGMVLMLVSGILNLVVERLMTSNGSSIYSIEQNMLGRGLLKVSDDSVFRTRMLFFGSRIAYGAFVGILVGIASYANPLMLSSKPVAAMIIVAICIGIAGVFVRTNNRFSSLYTITTLPVLLVISGTIAFFSPDPNNLIRLFATMSEVVWISQLYTQLPTYRELTKLHPVTFAYSEKLISLIVFEFVVYATMTVPIPLIQIPGVEIGVVFGLVIFTIIVIYSLARHVVRYHPLSTVEPSRSKAPTEEKERAVAHLAKEYGLTPKETEVFSFLACGYSRPYIEKSLYIAKGTAKAHTHRIYQKLGINSQDELIEIYKDEIDSYDV